VRRRDQLLELAIELEQFTIELADAAGEAAQRELGGLERLVQASGVGSQVQAELGSRLDRAAVS
jgi:hypothetical protein